VNGFVGGPALRADATYSRPSLTMISILLPTIIPKRKAAKRANVICASNIVIAVVKARLAISASSNGDQGMFSTIISQTSCPLPCSIALAAVHRHADDSLR
jgi:hypothetical protein